VVVTRDGGAEARFRGLIEAAPDAIVGVDAAGQIVLVNAQTERLFGYTREELIGQRVEMLVPDAARAGHPDQRRAYMGEPVHRPMGAGLQLAARRRDGSEFPADISLSALETDDGILVSASIRDVSERLEAQADRDRLGAQAEREREERRLHQSQRLESLGQLAGGVAHDFNNLLAVILNYASFVADEVAKAAVTEEARWAPVGRDVEQIRLAAERAARLTRQLLTFARREVVQPRVLSMNHVVREVEELMHRTLGEHIELRALLTPEIWSIMADPGQVEQVLINVALNARDAMSSGGTLTIETANLMVDSDLARSLPGLTPGRHVRLQVSDTGIGMDERVMSRVFEPFFTTKDKGEGWGLGLATVYGIVTQAGGATQLLSTPGLGTVFRAFFPASDALAAVHDRAPAHGITGGTETVLVVEDEGAMRELTRRLLVRHGYTVLATGTGAEALEIAAGHAGRIDLLLTDVVMPKMLGPDVAARLCAIRPESRVLYMSGYAGSVLASQGTLAPGIALLEKPFGEPLLLAKVREVLDAGSVTTA
jgi:PAS domain S-box-containing protein